MNAMATKAPPDVATRPDASMSLLTNLIEHSLDEGYAEAAARRGEYEAPRRPGLVLWAGLLMVGLLLATAAAQVRDRKPAAAEARKALAAEIEQRTAATDRLEGELQRLRASVEQARADELSLTASGQSLVTELRDLSVVTGASAVTGPGLVVRVEDAADAEDPTGTDDPRSEEERVEGRVSDHDLQTIVNAVWAAGAEAVAVNDQRLTSLSAIRAAGQAILVDFRPLSPPYDIVAVGDADLMRSRLVEGYGGSYLDVLEDFGITYSLATRDSVQLPASASIRVRVATVPARNEGAQ